MSTRHFFPRALRTDGHPSHFLYARYAPADDRDAPTDIPRTLSARVTHPRTTVMHPRTRVRRPRTTMTNPRTTVTHPRTSLALCPRTLRTDGKPLPIRNALPFFFFISVFQRFRSTMDLFDCTTVDTTDEEFLAGDHPPLSSSSNYQIGGRFVFTLQPVTRRCSARFGVDEHV